MDRLLTREERDKAVMALLPDATWGENREAELKAQDTKTLKAVEKWLGIMQNFSGVELYHAFKKKFLRGEMLDD